MPAHVPPKREEPEPELTPEQMLRVKAHVMDRLRQDYHSHRMTARLYRNQGNVGMAKVEEAAALELRRMLMDLEEEAEPMKGTSIRLLEDDGA